ncbi:Aspartyl/glutamyl-tRNA(Asn/Gln) amidotransferase subunit B [Alphaproteobacteria bacterium]
MIVKGKTANWEVVIGLEIHAQIISKSKIFSPSSTEFGADPNANVSFIDAALPGTLPVLNEKCVEQAVKTGLSLNAIINLYSLFDRKNYFYADSPQGYQISQFTYPIVGRGELIVDMPDGISKSIGITRIHLEQDAGKSLHDQSPTESFIDLNRAGIGLMEIVTEPDMRSGEEAAEFVKKLRSILRYIGACDGDMEKGSLRCDANISVRHVGASEFGERVEVKNINSIKNISRAIAYEAKRQTDLLENRNSVQRETRLFDAGSNSTKSMRTKEEAEDYRYFPEPNLLPVILTQEYIDEIRLEMPELPDQKKVRYIAEYNLSNYDASVIVSDKDVASYFESVAQLTNPKFAANWITAELFGCLNEAGITITESKIMPEGLAKLINMITSNVISGKIAKKVFEIMFSSGELPEVIVEREGLIQIIDVQAIENVVSDVINKNPDKVLEYKSGKDKLFAFFVGQIMQIMRGKANPAIVNDILKKELGKC